MVQKLDAGGSAVWQANGLPLEINKNSGAVLPLEPSVVSDGAGGAIAVWRDRRQETALYAQRVDAGGALAWQAGGIKVAATSLNPHHQVIAGAPGEALVSYSFLRDWETLRVQKLDSRGQTLWQVNGVPVVEKSFDGYSISSDGQGGMIVAWGVNGGRVGSERAYVQRIGTDGRVLWGEGGVKLN